MRTRKAGIVLLLAAASLCGAASGPLAYTVITRDGHRIVTVSEPEIRGIHVYMRLAPHGQLVVIQEVRVDWEKTEAVNPKENEMVLPSDTDLAAGAGNEGDTAAIRHTIRGNKDSDAPAASEEGASEAAPREPGSGPAEPTDPYAAEALVRLRREHAKLSSLRSEAAESLRVMEKELQELRGRLVREAATDASDERRARELQLLIDGVRRRISKYDGRIDDIRAEALRHGGTVD